MLRVMSCNVRYSAADDGENNWAARRDLCAEVIRAHAPDVVCFQEMWGNQAEDLSFRLGEFEPFGTADQPVGRNPMNTIFYRREMFRRVSAGSYWLSETPHVPGSKSWDSMCPRLATWIRLEAVDAKKEFRVVNTHLDHIGQTARERQALLIDEDAGAYPPDYPQILTGDMNADISNRAVQNFLADGWVDTYTAVHKAAYPDFTFHKFAGPGYVPDAEYMKGRIGKIDWIFVRGAVRPVRAGIVDDCVNGRYPSDHYFLTAELDLPVGGAKGVASGVTDACRR